MSNTDAECLQSAEQAFVERVLEGLVVDKVTALPEDAEKLLETKESLRSKALELFADSVFYKAAARLVELLEDEDPKVCVQAAKALVDLRRDVYKVQATKKTVKPLLDKLFEDGFSF